MVCMHMRTRTVEVQHKTKPTMQHQQQQPCLELDQHNDNTRETKTQTQGAREKTTKCCGLHCGDASRENLSSSRDHLRAERQNLGAVRNETVEGLHGVVGSGAIPYTLILFLHLTYRTPSANGHMHSAHLYFAFRPGVVRKTACLAFSIFGQSILQQEQKKPRHPRQPGLVPGEMCKRSRPRVGKINES
ncbi:Thiamin biosynthesis protein (Thi-4), putative [Anopheles sinensis]|uniref:Thiamin biosynthesis protein (Thi-4), putative n=1 Tax=Anopheles sinensis TaxID=74873 RepID=A0A084VMI9_ANOSI|nr:Thiamin biosynthesis protein (Thi-4), putative [Anopheles sinensis]